MSDECPEELKGKAFDINGNEVRLEMRSKKKVQNIHWACSKDENGKWNCQKVVNDE